MTGRTCLWAELKAPAFHALPRDAIAILPLGAVEQHGPHLPLSVDYDLVEAVLERALPQIDTATTALVLPTLRVTKSDEHMRHPGTLTLSAETLLAVLRDIGASVARAGVRRMVLFNGHGGNTALLQVAARDLRIRHEMIAACCNWSGFAEVEGLFDPSEYARDLHAGASETSAMLAARPELVDMTVAPAPDSVLPACPPQLGLMGEPAKPAWIIDDLTRTGVVGNARDADAERGAALIDSAARSFAAFLDQFRSFDNAG